jgi:hypothetical protein
VLVGMVLAGMLNVAVDQILPAFAAVIGDPLGLVQIATSGESANGSVLAVSNGGSANGYVAASSTGGSTASGAAISGTGCATGYAAAGGGCANGSAAGASLGSCSTPSGYIFTTCLSVLGCASNASIQVAPVCPSGEPVVGVGCGSAPTSVSIGTTCAWGTAASIAPLGCAYGGEAVGEACAVGGIAVSGGSATGCAAAVGGQSANTACTSGYDTLDPGVAVSGGSAQGCEVAVGVQSASACPNGVAVSAQPLGDPTTGVIAVPPTQITFSGGGLPTISSTTCSNVGWSFTQTLAAGGVLYLGGAAWPGTTTISVNASACVASMDQNAWGTGSVTISGTSAAGTPLSCSLPNGTYGIGSLQIVIDGTGTCSIPGRTTTQPMHFIAEVVPTQGTGVTSNITAGVLTGAFYFRVHQ